ncbi:GNAT family acetyltransferase [Fulvitalea axinellae]|uniref:GNAT family acetyltransferase n=1 Tax=Fulvitalea axinellae TaxID=1182444 RepID=A0AAU9C6W2_9BACT|nr:GNAT family acetyltransferase [Fulvitalea axinellae]
MEKLIDLNSQNLRDEHICCAISDKKCVEGYEAKKDWLEKEFANGYTFRRIDARAKVFTEFGPAENAWVPVEAPGYLLINCFWVSGRYKKQGYGKKLLASVMDDARNQGKHGVVTVVGKKKYHFMGDGKWFLRQGFEISDETPDGFLLLAKKLDTNNPSPTFSESVKQGGCPEANGLVAYYSNRCPFTEYHVRKSLEETAQNRNLPLKIIKLETAEQARQCSSPATIFSLFLDGKFVTTDVSVCMDSRFDRILEKSLVGR